MPEEKKEEEKKEMPMRQIILETNGNDIKIIKAEVAGNIEMIGILESVINHLKGNIPK